MTTPPHLGGSPGADRSHDRPNRSGDVMDTAIQVMSERGYAATSMREIADRVGMLKGSLYHYFTSKEELLLQILEDSHAQVDAISQRVAARGLSPLDELLTYVHDAGLWYVANVERANIFFTDRRQLTGERYVQAMRLGRAYERRLLSLVCSGQEAGEIRTDHDGRLVSRFVMGSLNNVRLWPNRNSPGPEPEDMADALVALVRDAVAAR